MQDGTFEPDETRQIQNLLNSADAFINVGANVGYYVLLARQRLRNVIAIEPLPDNVELLKWNLIANGFDDVEILPVGCGSRPSISKIYGGGTAASLVLGWAGMDRDSHRLIPLTTMDNLLARRFDGERLLILIDVEGFELQVLLGAESLLARQPAPVWLVEICVNEHQSERGGVNPNLRETFELFWTAGYVAEYAGLEGGLVTREDITNWEALQNLPRTHNFLFRNNCISSLGNVPR